jgi:GNAT superfamily N-acetyltransferase
VALGPDGAPVYLARVRSGRYPDSARVDLRAAEAAEQIGADAVSYARYDEHGRVVVLELPSDGWGKAPPLWFVEVVESTARPPATNLVAFTGGDVAPGTLLDSVDATRTGVSSQDQLGAVRWYPATGEIDQIYVAPQWRRHSVATALLVLASTLSVARDWPRFWSDGQRTLLGEKLRNGLEWGHRAADLTHIAPPMTPGDAG